MKLIYIGGVHAVGKGTIIENYDTSDFKIVNYSKNMVMYTQEDSNDDMNSISYEKRLKIRDKVYKDLMLSTDNMLVDSHYSILIMRGTLPDRFEFGIPDYFLPSITDFILIETQPEVILERRNKDSGKRRIIDENIIKIELSIERQFAELLAKRSNKELNIIDNSSDLEKATEKFQNLIGRL